MEKGERISYRSLLRNVDVERWYDNVARGSVVTADVYLRSLAHSARASISVLRSF